MSAPPARTGTTVPGPADAPGPDAPDPDREHGPPQAVDAGPLGATRSRAGEYRRRRNRRKAPWKWTAIEATIFVVVVVIVYLATAPPPAAPGSNPSGGGPSGSPPIQLGLSAPTIGNSSCGGQPTYSTEQFRLDSVPETVYTNQVTLLLVELGDGDVIASTTTPPDVTASSVCAGSPPTGSLAWYAALVSPSGSVVTSFNYAQGWAPVPGAQFPAPITPGASLVLVLAQPIAGFGYGLEVTGVVGAPEVSGVGIL
jgi:hypothetical protein